MASQRVTIGFNGSQVLSVKVEDADLESLLEALSSAGWHDLTVDDGTIRMNLAQVAYVSTNLDAHRVGFGLGA